MNKTLEGLQATLEELKGRLKIDKNRLEDELEAHSEIFYEVCEAHARAVSLRDELKAGLDESYAICATEVRQEFEGGKERFTEAQIKEAVAMKKEYLDASAAYLEAKKLTDLLSGLRDAFDSRGRMMKELAQLFIAGYFSTVRVESGGKAVAEAYAAGGKAAMAEARKPIVSKTGAVKKFGKRD